MPVIYAPCVVLVCGPMYHGKTTVAKALAAKSNLQHFDLDEIKAEMFGRGWRRLTNWAMPVRSQLNTRRTDAVYAEAARLAMSLFQRGIPCVLSGTFSWDSFKSPFKKAVVTRELPLGRLQIFDLEIKSLDEIKRRIKLRSQDQNVDVEDKLMSYMWSKDQQKDWPKGMRVKKIDAMQDVGEVVRQISRNLQQVK